MTPYRTAASVFFLIVAISATLSACETAPPVQEMSDARQAIAVAREAGAVDRAAMELQEAERFLKRAEQSLNQRDYDEARDAAMQAHERAKKALRMAEADRETRFQ